MNKLTLSVMYLSVSLANRQKQNKKKMTKSASKVEAGTCSIFEVEREV